MKNLYFMTLQCSYIILQMLQFLEIIRGLEISNGKLLRHKDEICI